MIAERLRKAVLQAAIQGKLTEQLPEDGDARELLAEIESEKQRLVKEGKIKKQKPLPKISEDEIPFEIPENWCWVRLDDVGETNVGLTYRPIDVSLSGTLVLRSSNIQNEQLDYADCVYVTCEIPENKICRPGDILICARNGSKRLVGKAAIIDRQGMSFGAFMAIFRSRFNEYIHRYISTPYFREDLDGVGTTTINQITQANLRMRLMPLPPLLEQQRIVAKLEEVLPQIDKLQAEEEALAKLQDKFPQKLKNSLLQAAIQGGLTEQLPEDGDAKGLLAEIEAEKERLIEEGKIRRQKLLPETAEEEIPFEIPENWCWVRLGEIAVLNPRNKIDDDEKVSFIPMALIQDGYGSDHGHEQRAWGQIKSGYTHFAENDIVVAKITPCFQNRKSAIMRGLASGYGAGTTELHVVRPLSEWLNNRYLLCLFKTEHFIHNGCLVMTGTAGQQRIGRDYLENLLIPLPPFPEQQRIVARLEELLPLCDASVIV